MAFGGHTLPAMTTCATGYDREHDILILAEDERKN